MSHHEHDPMKGHHRVVNVTRKRWWHPLVLRKRSDTGDYVVRAGLPYPYAVYSYVSGHKDAPLTTRARLLWWFAGLVIIVAGITLIVLSR